MFFERTVCLITLALSTSQVLLVNGGDFQLVREHSNGTFLDGWNFFNGESTDGSASVVYQTREQALQQQMVFLNSQGNFVIKVDNTTDGRNDSSFRRPSVKLLSTYNISIGTLIMMDAVHMPFGCSGQGTDMPDDGAIDIFHGVNMGSHSSASLHTVNGCRHTSSANVRTEAGRVISEDCFYQTNNDQGCAVELPGTSFGEPLASIGGGVFALLWNTLGISAWFIPRPELSRGIDPIPSSWGLPDASYSRPECDTSTVIKPQTLVLDITICGNEAGRSDIFQQTCSGNCLDLVQTPSNYDNAYFEISYIRVYEQVSGSGVPPATIMPSSTPPLPTSTSSGNDASRLLPSIPGIVSVVMYGLSLFF